MEVFWTLLQGFAALAFLVGVHEAGHMVAAKLFGMRVEKFSIGFPPKLFGFTKGETEYSLGLIPLGGFVKISGMVDESFDTANLDKEPEPWEFRAKPAWQRLIVMLGGIIVNVVTGIIIFIMLTYFVAELKTPITELNHGIHVDSTLINLGFQDGDKILSTNGEPVKYFEDVMSENFFQEGSPKVIEVRHPDGSKATIDFPDSLVFPMLKGELIIEPRIKFKIDSVIAYGKADLAGIKVGDSILAVNGQAIQFYNQFRDSIIANKGAKVSLTVLRLPDTLVVNSEVNENGKIEVSISRHFNHDTVFYSFSESIGIGVTKAFRVITNNIIGFRRMINGKEKVSDNLSGPVGIFRLFGGSFIHFWKLVAILSMVLAFMNLLPIPALDGGHVIFLLYEMITGRKPSDKFMEIAIKIGFAILLTLILFAVGNDIFKLFK